VTSPQGVLIYPFQKTRQNYFVGSYFFTIFVKILFMEYKCPKCGETKNLHFNYDYAVKNLPIINVLCNECGEFFGEKKQNDMDPNEKRSTHWADVLVWLDKVAKSCTTKEQAASCETLVWNFHRKYQKTLGLAECFNLTKEIDKILLEFKLPAFYKKQKL
jgi:protein-arginine kinase activator protein McsA